MNGMHYGDFYHVSDGSVLPSSFMKFMGTNLPKKWNDSALKPKKRIEL